MFIIVKKECYLDKKLCVVVVLHHNWRSCSLKLVTFDKADGFRIFVQSNVPLVLSNQIFKDVGEINSLLGLSVNTMGPAAWGRYPKAEYFGHGIHSII